MAASKAFITTFKDRALVPTENYDWDDYDYRRFRYAFYEAYYSNYVYRDVARFNTTLKENRALYQHIRGVYNPAERIVEAYVSKVYGGPLDFENLASGALPMSFGQDVDAEALKVAIRQTWVWSNWRAQKSLFVRQGAKLGDAFIKVVDDPARGRVRLEVLHPGKVREVETDEADNIKHAVIEYERMIPDSRKPQTYTYTEIIDKERFAAFKDGEPFPIFQVGDEFIHEFANPYGFVPLIQLKHRDVGLQWGVNAFDAQREKIDEINDAASLLNDNVRKHVNAIWYFAGVDQSDEITAKQSQTADGSVRRDTLDALYGPEGSQPHPMVAPLDISAAGQNVDRLLSELERDLPELALHRLRDGGNATRPGVLASYNDAIDRFAEAQGNYDDGYIRAQQMAISIGGFRGYEGFEPFNLKSFDEGALAFFIKPRPIIEDELSKEQRVQSIVQIGTLPPGLQRLALKQLGFSDDEIDEAVGEVEEETEPMADEFSDAELEAAVADLEELGFNDQIQQIDNEAVTQNGAPTTT